MLPIMVKEADLNQIEAPEDYEVLDATALGRRLGFKRETVLAYLERHLCGSGSHLGPGVSMDPGRNIAQETCPDLGIDFRWMVAAVT